MANVAINTYYRVTIICRAIPQNGVNVKRLKITAVPVADVTEAELANAIFDHAALVYQPCLNVAASLRRVVIQNVTAVLPGPPIPSTRPLAQGLTIGDMLPPQVSGLIKLQTDTGGRKGRGRAYIPFPSESDSEVAGYPIAGYVGRLQAVADEYVGDQNFAVLAGVVTGQWGLYTLPAAPGSWKPFTSGVARSAFGTQRRRSYLGRGDANV